MPPTTATPQEPNPAGATSKRINLAIASIGGLVGLIAVGILFHFNPATNGFYPYCVFSRVTGLLCPGCGSLRSLHQLLHGHVMDAFHYNALLMLSLPFLAWLSLRWLRSICGVPLKPLHVRPVWVWTVFVVLVLFGILRNLPLASLDWLRP
jgi:hypothetical protein